jgi:ABC-type nickel/cobalt efflux system permease component RcnA
LTAYPSDLLDQPLDERSTEVILQPGGRGSAHVASPDPAASAVAPGGVAAEIGWLPDLAHLGVGTALLGLLVAAAAGAGHALSPGHGKTVMAAYLIGSRGRTRDALVLGAAVTFSHTAGVLLLAAVVLLASDLLPPERLYPVLGAVSGIAVALIGLWLLVGCVRRYRFQRRHRLAHAHGDEHGHAHEHAHGHSHAHGHAHVHEGAGDATPGLRGLVALGIAGGLVPSTAALLLLLAAVSAGQPLYGLAMALAFGAGMAATLTGVGLAVVRGRELVARRLAGRLPRARLAVTAAPWVVSLVVLVGGVVLAGQALATRL